MRSTACGRARSGPTRLPGIARWRAPPRYRALAATDASSTSRNRNRSSSRHLLFDKPYLEVALVGLSHAVLCVEQVGCLLVKHDALLLVPLLLQHLRYLLRQAAGGRRRRARPSRQARRAGAGVAGAAPAVEHAARAVPAEARRAARQAARRAPSAAAPPCPGGPCRCRATQPAASTTPRLRQAGQQRHAEAPFGAGCCKRGEPFSHAPHAAPQPATWACTSSGQAAHGGVATAAALGGAQLQLAQALTALVRLEEGLGCLHPACRRIVPALKLDVHLCQLHECLPSLVPCRQSGWHTAPRS